MRVLFAPDKFKGSLTAHEAAAAMAAGWCEVFPDATVLRRPVADGGEGSAQAVCNALAGRWVEREVHDPLGRPVTARYALVETPAAPGRSTAFVECSAASGYLRVQPSERDLLRSSTFGTGELLAHAFHEGAAARVIVGLGGSATNDGGLGLAAALGYAFLDRQGERIRPVPAELHRLTAIVPPPWRPWLDQAVVAACDVQNPLLGPRGATAVYGPQKGLQISQQDTLEDGLRRLADVAKWSLDSDLREMPGAGAAGGLGFGLLTFCAARLESGFGLISRLVGLEEAMTNADLVLTGEGAADAQSLEGKTPHGVAAMARRLGKPVVLIAGTIFPEDKLALREHFDAVYAMTDTGHDLAACMRDAPGILRDAAKRAALVWRKDLPSRLA